MSHDVQIEELLSAYLTGDVTPAERAAVEQRLAHDSGLRHQLAELQTLVAMLKQAQRPVTAKMLAELKRRVAQAGTLQTSDLLAAATTGDLTPTERAAVDQLLSKNSQARRELTSLQAMSKFLKKGELPVSKNAGRSLVDRLSSKIPAAALAPVLPSADETVAIQLKTSAPTVRIYAVQESPWRKRILRASAAIAAALLFAAGAIFGMRALKPDTEAGVADATPSTHTSTDIQPGSLATGEGSGSSVVTPPNPGDITPPGSTDHAPIVPPAPPLGVQETKTDVLPTPVSPPARNTQATQSTVPSVNPPVAPKNTPRNTSESGTPHEAAPARIGPVEPVHGPDDQAFARNPKATNPGGVPFIQINPGTNNNGNGNTTNNGAANSSGTGNANSGNGNSGSTAPTAPTTEPTTNPKTSTATTQGSAPLVPFANPQAPTAPAQPQEAPPADNSFIAAVDGKLVAGVLRGNDAAAELPDGTQQTIQLKNELPSGSIITTGNTRLAFVLPGDGRLWVNSHTKVTIQLHGLNTVATLDSGEISYRAPHTGNISVNSGSLQANTTGLMDVALDTTQGTMTVYSFDGTTRLIRKGKPAITLNKQRNEVIAKLDLSDSPAAQSGPATVLLWQQDLNVNGETADGLTTTSKKDDKSSRSRSRK